MNGATVAFLTAFLSGLLSIVVGAWFGLNWLANGGAVASVIIYSMFASRVERWRVSREQFGDSAYFLGFLFTLTALILTLWTLPSALEEGRSSASVIPQFALALSTTITGLIARMLISGFTANQEQAVDEAEAALAASSVRLRGQMDVFVHEMSNHATATQKVMSTVLDEAQKAIQAHVQALEPLPGQVETAMQAVTERLENSIGAALDPLSKAAGKAAEDLEASTRTLSESAKEAGVAALQPLSEAASQAAAAVVAATASLATIQSSSSGIAKHLQEQADVIAVAGQKLPELVTEINPHPRAAQRGSRGRPSRTGGIQDGP